jgi:hypothetical protein
VLGRPKRRGDSATLAATAPDQPQRSGRDCTTIVLADMRIEPCGGHVDCGERPCPHADDMPGILAEVEAHRPRS